MVVLFQPRAENTRTLDSGLFFRTSYVGPIDGCVPPSLSPPPPPFLVQPYLSRYPPDQRESIFVVVPLTLSPSVPPGIGPVELLTAVMAPFHFHPTPSYAMLVGRSRLALIGI